MAREILFIDQLLIYLSLFPLACSGFDVAGLLKDGDHQGRIGRAEIGICKPQRRATAFILPLEILSAGTVVVLNGRCAEGFGEAFACGFKFVYAKGAVAGLSLTIVSLEPIADSSSVVSMPNGAVEYA